MTNLTPGTLLLVVPTYRAFEYAHQAVFTALASDEGVRVAVVDDGSPGWPGDGHFEDIHRGRVTCHRYPKNDRNLTRSWNWGARLARDLKFPYVAFGNSDLKFPVGWWDPIRAYLDDGRLHLAGPLTNAPGHRRHQEYTQYLKKSAPLGTVPAPSDGDVAMATVMKGLARRFGASPQPLTGHLNGFLLAGKTDVLWADAHDANHLFNPGPRFKMTRNEDEFCGKLITRGRRVGAVPTSYVFHYRGVSRPEGRRGKQAAGMYRKPTEVKS